MTDEFAIIRRYFGDIGRAAESTLLGIGDDAAIIEIPAGYQQAVTMDTLIEGVHFAHGTAPADIAYKSLAVNISDLVAMAASPAWFLLSLTLGRNDAGWLTDFSQGLGQAAERFAVQLVGGDTCRGPLSVSIQAGGFVPNGQYVTRAGASAGDLVLVSGELGGAALGLAHLQGRNLLPDRLAQSSLAALNRPSPRLELIEFLRRNARAAIDISDGLAGDLRHVLEASGCGARLHRDAIPVSDWIRENGAWEFALQGGDDYQICCCVARDRLAEVDSWNRENSGCRLTRIGEITASGYFLESDGESQNLEARRGYRHFD